MRYPENVSTILLLFLGFQDIADSAEDKVYIRNIQVLAFHRGRNTTTRHNTSVPQIQCAGGEAKGKIDPWIVYCYNRGHDGFEIVWECKTQMNTSLYEIGMVNVHCEGFDSPEDKNVLRGSCGLEYTLQYAFNPREEKSVFPALLFIFGSISLLVLCSCIAQCLPSDKRREHGEPGSSRRAATEPNLLPSTSATAPPPSYDDIERGLRHSRTKSTPGICSVFFATRRESGEGDRTSSE